MSRPGGVAASQAKQANFFIDSPTNADKDYPSGGEEHRTMTDCTNLNGLLLLPDTVAVLERRQGAPTGAFVVIKRDRESIRAGLSDDGFTDTPPRRGCCRRTLLNKVYWHCCWRSQVRWSTLTLPPAVVYVAAVDSRCRRTSFL